ncbi:MAG: OmpP1/FadL family transporter [Planctomycetaceae bacterium]
MKRTLRPAMAGLCWMLCVSSSSADGLFLNGVSPRSIGRGGTNIGFADNGAALFDNPAAMVNLPGQGLVDVGVDVLFTDFNYSDPQNLGVSSKIASPLPQISVIRKSADERFAFGVGLFAPAGFSEEYEMTGPPLMPGPRHYESFGALVKVLPGFAWKVTDRLAIGGTLGLGYSQIELEGPYVLQSAGLPTVMKTRADGFAVVGSLGLQFQATDTTTLGLTWQSESRFGLDGDTFVGLGPGFAANYDADLRIKWPRSIAFGVRQQLADYHTVSADVTWLNWSESFDTASLHLSSPTMPLFPPAVVEHIPLQWQDTVSMRLGYEYDLGSQETLRLGYVYTPNPIPAATLSPFIQSIMEHGFSCGYGFPVLGCEIDISYMFTFGPDQHVGTSAFIGGDFDNSSTSAQTHAIGISAIRRF